ncbi:AsnC family transcriptional regulator [Desulfovibrio sp. X2]|uniref:siroheme decarboxylase subunit alpha n=1 Tax=Desulfovibrio sp. X2 TaxID=941449 RepID=UPI0003FBCF3D|nr:AsnC family transcriptional regulator [Desulfovibrio sp. X2]
MDDLDKRLLDIIQSHFPLVSRPYRALGRELGLTEAETLARVRALKASGIIRRTGANFQSGKLGWHSTLCAAHVSDDKLDAFTAEVNRHVGVTHNYLRRHFYNVWFSYIGEDAATVQAKLKAITQKTGVPIMYLPAEKVYKIKVDFKMKRKGDA